MNRILLLTVLFLTTSLSATASDGAGERHERIRHFLQEHPEVREKFRAYLKEHPEAREKLRERFQEFLSQHPEIREKLREKRGEHHHDTEVK